MLCDGMEFGMHDNSTLHDAEMSTTPVQGGLERMACCRFWSTLIHVHPEVVERAREREKERESARERGRKSRLKIRSTELDSTATHNPSVQSRAQK